MDSSSIRKDSEIEFQSLEGNISANAKGACDGTSKKNVDDTENATLDVTGLLHTWSRFHR